MSNETVQANGLRVHYRLSGPAQAPVIVFVHGIGASLEAWDGQSERLSDRFRILTYDLRSHGSTSAVQETVRLSGLAADLVALLDSLDIEKAAVVGHSAGGVIAMQSALDHPLRLSALGLVGTASECNDKTASWYTKCIEVARESGGKAVMKLMGMNPELSPPPDGLGVSYVIEAMRSLNTSPLTQSLRALELPTWIIVGEKDFLGVGGSVILSRAIAGSQLEIIKDAPHGFYIKDPASFAIRAGKFFDPIL